MNETANAPLVGDAGSPPGADPGMWWHHCRIEKDMIATGKGEPCNWCSRTEHGKP